MQKLTLLLIVCFIAAVTAAEDKDTSRTRTYPYTYPRVYSRTYPRSESYSEKRFEAMVTPNDPNPFWLNTTSGDLWKLDPDQMVWVYIGDPRGAPSGAKGTYQLLPYQPGEVIILNTSSGEAWWTDGQSWINIKDPSTRRQK